MNIQDPYRTPGEKEEPIVRIPSFMDKYAGFVFAFGLGAAFICFCSVMVHCDGIKQEKKDAEWAAEKKARANSCGFEDVDKGFKIVSYDGDGNERAEGFFSTRKEADDFKDNLPRCHGK